VKNTIYQRYTFCSFAHSIRRKTHPWHNTLCTKRQYKRHDNGVNI